MLGPLLFSLYTSPVGQLISSYGISHQQYADDTQLFISIPPAAPTSTVQLIEQCLIPQLVTDAEHIPAYSRMRAVESDLYDERAAGCASNNVRIKTVHVVAAL